MTSKSLNRRLAMLAYHKIGSHPSDGWDTWHYIPENVFFEQLKFVRDSDWTVIDAAAFLSSLDNPQILPRRSLLLTFDDGHRSMREIALPLLRQFGFPAVCFTPTGYIGGLGAFDQGVEPEEPMCDWDDLRHLDGCNVSVQSHGVSHYWFSLMDEEQQWSELVLSKQALESQLNKPVTLFAFPYSDSASQAGGVDNALQRAGYRAAFLCGEGPGAIRTPVGNPYRIHRLAVYRDTNLDLELNRKPARRT